MKAPSTALARLALSRERLRAGLQDRPAVGAVGGIDDLDSFFAGLKSLPVATLLFELTKTWWHKQPLGAAATLLVNALKAGVQTKCAPLALRHPIVLVCGAAALGGLLVWARPWRWGLVKPALLAGLAQQLLAKALSGNSLETWLAGIAAFSAAPAPAAAAATAKQD